MFSVEEKTLPLSWRLALSTFLISLFTLIIMLFVILHANAANYKKELFSQMKSYITELNVLMNELYEITTPEEDELLYKWLESGLNNRNYETMLLYSDHSIIDTSQTLSVPYTQFMEVLPEDSPGVFWTDENCNPYLLARSTVYIEGGVFGYILVARDLDEGYAKIKSLKMVLFWISVAVSLAISGLSFVFSKATLRPVSQISGYINTIDASDLHRRLNAADWPRELRPIVNSFDKMLNRLEDNFVRLNQFSSDLAHELRTPIHQLKIAVEVTLSKDRTPQEYTESLESVLDGAERLNRIVENILFIARAEDRKTAITTQAVDTAALAARVKEFFQIVAEEKHVDINTSSVSGIINADEQMLSRALVNIVGNAMQYVGDGGHIDIGSRSAEDNFIISITNDGPAIAPEHIENLFDRFYKADYSRGNGEDYQGSGLGLSIVKSIMKLHGGRAQARNLDGGHGVAFDLIFPLK
ncbi:two-component system heavy metal sensor histidine kinase CusS [Elusimicrobium simillimum]|uniref:heavy metal sensor histidine kinase n=1 Tax=Elusimicrobium simillimum TaxID=3143438 RepID=UPI003C6EA6D1